MADESAIAAEPDKKTQEYIEKKLSSDSTIITFQGDTFIAEQNEEGTHTGTKPGRIFVKAAGHGDKRVVFRDCKFWDPLDLSGAEFSTLSFVNCTFGPENDEHKLKQNVAGELNAGKLAWLTLDEVIARTITLDLSTSSVLEKTSKSTPSPQTTGFSIDARRCSVLGNVSVSLKTALTLLRLDESRIDGRALINCMNITTSLLIGLKDTIVDGVLEINAAKKSVVNLALNGEGLRVKDELRLNRVALLGSEPNDYSNKKGRHEDRNALLGVSFPAISLARADLGGLRLGLKKQSGFNPKQNETERTGLLFSGAYGQVMSPVTSIADLHVSKIGTYVTHNDAPSNNEDFWVSFIREMTPRDTKTDDMQTNTLVRLSLYAEFARAAERSNYKKVADMMLARESQMERERLKQISKDAWKKETLCYGALLFFSFGATIACLRHLFSHSPRDILINISMGDLFIIFLLTFMVLLFWSIIQKKQGAWLEFQLRGLLAWISQDGLTPFRVGMYLVLLWIIASVFAWSAMVMGYFAPEEAAIYRAETEFLAIAEIGDGTKDSSDPVAVFHHPTYENLLRALDAREKDNGMRPFDYSNMTGPQSNEDAKRAKLRMQYRDILVNTPLNAFHAACRHNWAEPEQIDREVWAATLLGFYNAPQPFKPKESGVNTAEQMFGMIDPSGVCERLLPAEYSQFSPWIYAADIVLPLLDLRLEEEWSLRVTQPHQGASIFWAQLFRIIEVGCTMVGWFFALILAGAVTNLGEGRRSRL